MKKLLVVLAILSFSFSSFAYAEECYDDCYYETNPFFVIE